MICSWTTTHFNSDSNPKQKFLFLIPFFKVAAYCRTCIKSRPWLIQPSCYPFFHPKKNVAAFSKIIPSGPNSPNKKSHKIPAKDVL